ncbi:MAG: anaerobic ribonucleoside-triphosphate reductase activating protein, partial [Lachnospiraceae bacterium]|nr:anaerobic ribonucleoside-triphosphate reductase activating protein [Lachnospiraceae bacterium]
EASFEKIGSLIHGAEKYYLQAYVDSDRVIKPGFSSYTKEELEAFLPGLKNHVKIVEIRGIE